ncbi:hypothetical protein ACWD6R_32585 [Streptomyces sp. NPDC005151]
MIIHDLDPLSQQTLEGHEQSSAFGDNAQLSMATTDLFVRDPFAEHASEQS